MKKTGIVGGTFDPVHIGHLITAMFVKEIRMLDKIIFIPAHISPFKKDKKSAPGLERLEMLRLATETIPFFEVSDYEITRGDISYTYDTLKHLKTSRVSLELVLGYDNIHSFDKWKNPGKITELAKLIIMKRGSGNYPVNNKFADKAVFLDTPRIDISSTEIRDRIKTGRNIDFLVPDKVKSYIEERSLYQ